LDRGVPNKAQNPYPFLRVGGGGTWFGRGVPLEAQNPYPFLRVIL